MIKNKYTIKRFSIISMQAKWSQIEGNLSLNPGFWSFPDKGERFSALVQ